MPAAPRFFPVLLLPFILPALCADECYYPDGTLSDEYYICDSSSSDSACCPAGFACIGDNFCSTNDSNPPYTRGLCSDPYWLSPACPQHCYEDYRRIALTLCRVTFADFMKAFGDLRGVDVDLGTCGGSDPSVDGYYEFIMCCEVSDECCASSSDRFFTVSEIYTTTAIWNGLEQQYYVPAKPTTVYLTTTYSNTTSTSTSTSISTPGSANWGTKSSSFRITAVPNLSTYPSPSSDPSQETDSEYTYGENDSFSGGRIGGVVAGVCIAVGGIVGSLLWRSRRKRLAQSRLDPARRHNNPHHFGPRQDSDMPGDEEVMVEADPDAVRPVELGGKTFVEAPDRHSPGSSCVEKRGGSDLGEEHEMDLLVANEGKRKVSYELPADEERGRQ